MHAVRELDRSSSDRILDSAERLIGELGLEGVSLRQISLAAGLRNNYAVQYHFKDLAGLIGAIRARRLPEIEANRALIFAGAAREGKLADTRTLLDILYLPLINLSGGDRCYARFVLALYSARTSFGERKKTFESMPLAGQAVQLLGEANPGVPMPLIIERLRLISFMVLSSILQHRSFFDKAGDDRALVRQVLDMATAALCAPVSEEAADLVDAHVREAPAPE